MKRFAVIVAGVVALAVGAPGGGAGPAAAPAMRMLVYEHKGWIYRARLDGTNPVRVVRGEYPKISPDGRWIAFLRSRSRRVAELRVVAAAGGGATTLRAGELFEFLWLPDSRRLLVYDAHGIFVVGPGAAAVPFVQDRTADGTASDPSLSTDGSTVVFIRDDLDTGRSDIFSVPLAGGEERRLTSGGESNDPLMGPSEIAFTRSVGRRLELWAMNHDGSGQRRVAASRDWLRPTFWLPDGKRIVAYDPGFTLSGPNFGQLFAVEVTAGAVTPLTRVIEGLRPLGLSRDGRVMLALTGCTYFSIHPTPSPAFIKTIPIGGGKVRTILRGPCYADWNA